MKKILFALSILFIFGLSAKAQSRIYAPELKAPVSEAIEQSPDVLLDWLAVTGEGIEILYEVQLAENPDFASATTFPRTNITSMKMSNLLFGHVYYWRVRAIDDLGVSDWSVSWSFTVITTVLIESPGNLAVVSPDPVLKWKVLTGITGYDIQVDTSYSWKPLAGIVSSKLNDVFEVDADNAWFVGDNGVIVHKANDAYTVLSGITTSNLYDVYFIDANNGWVVGDGGTILYYNGTEFTAQTSGLTTALNGVYFTSATNGYAVGSAGKLLHFDGTEWTPVTSGVTLDLFSIHGNSANNIWAVGKTGNYTHFDGTSWTAGTYSNRDMNDVWVTASNKVWVAAKAGRIFSWNGSWSEQTFGSPPRDLQGVCFVNDQNGYIVGNNGTLLYFNGLVWQALASGTTETLYGVHFSSESSGYLVGNTGSLIAFQGEGFDSPYLKSYSTPGDILEFKLGNLLFGQAHYFRVRAKHAAATSDWSPASSFMVISKPTLVSPANNASNISLDTLAIWQAISGVAKYSIQLSLDADFTDPQYFESTAPEYRFDGLLFSKDYYWRVNARHAQDVSSWSDARKFSTANAVTLTEPAHQATDVTRLPRFTWQEIKGTEKYMIQFGKDNAFADAQTELTTTPLYQTILQLDKNTSYYWRVKAIQGLDSTNWSQVRSFVTTGETGIGENTENEIFSVYPNPGTGVFSMSLRNASSPYFTVEVYNLTGSKVFEQQHQTFGNEGKSRLDLTSLPKGMYLIRLYEGNAAYTKRLVIE